MKMPLGIEFVNLYTFVVMEIGMRTQGNAFSEPHPHFPLVPTSHTHSQATTIPTAYTNTHSHNYTTHICTHTHLHINPYVIPPFTLTATHTNISPTHTHTYPTYMNTCTNTPVHTPIYIHIHTQSCIAPPPLYSHNHIYTYNHICPYFHILLTHSHPPQTHTHSLNPQTHKFYIHFARTLILPHTASPPSLCGHVVPQQDSGPL